MAARSIWNGSLAVAELVIPVKLFAAVQPHRVQFREVRLGDGSRIAHRRFGAESGVEVPAERVQRGYETSPGHQVILTDEELAASGPSADKTIELEEFVALDALDPVLFDRPYLLAPQAGGERGYRVLHDALERSGKAGIGRFVLRSREQLVTLAPRDGALRIYTMRFADELVSSTELDPPNLDAAPTSKESAMARRLIDALSVPWDPAEHSDAFRDAVMTVIERKAHGSEVATEAPAERAPTPDLLGALQASLDQSGRKRRRPRQAAATPRSKRPVPGSKAGRR